ncbi:histone-lysine N-methyltransferase EZ1-like isoform X2 [Phragmites australis]|uniref:histone-lysine N-methyltransferase EZ1-like isoform X2 n=1 Tax=Phragmites australis TaxID=29695 RepID=UPI002D7891DA|nr:histone-lysine N-methyltransferase EZ1-like isoform X2 [Phragmites australis]
MLAPSITAVRSEEENVVSRYVLSVIDSLKKRITANRFTYIKNRIEQNKINLSTFTQNAYNLSKTRQNNTSNGTDVVSNFLTKRQDDALSTLHSPEICPADKDGDNCQEENSFSTSNAVLGGNLGARNAIRPIKLPEVPKLPPYTTWIFLDRNQRMTEDQSVLGRRRIYYDASCGEALICSDSEDEAIEDEEEKNGFKHSEDCIIRPSEDGVGVLKDKEQKKEFTDAEDFIFRMTIQECGLSDAVLEALAQHFVRAADDIKARYEILHGEKTEDSSKKMIEYNAKVEHLYCDKDLDAALDSFDNLFCRRCLVFDCKLHGCSQDLVFPTEKQPAWSGMDDGIPCGIHCYKMVSKLNSVAATDSHMLVDAEEPTHSSDNATNQPGLKRKKHGSSGRKTKSQQSESSSTARVASESSDSEIHPISSKSPQHSPSPSKVKIGSKGGIRKVTNRRIAERILMSVKKGQREMPQSDSSSLSGSLWARDMKLRSDTRNGNKDSFVSSQSNSPSTRSSRKKSTHQIGNNSVFAEAQNDSMEETNNQHSATAGYDSSRKEEFVDENICKQDDNCRSWKVIEQGLLVKGLEIFGRNSCLIARNLLGGMKTCRDVSQYMNYIENSSASGALSGVDSLVKGYIKGNELRARSRFFRRRGKVRRLKYTWKSAGYHFIRKRITERKDQPCRQYNPCGCQSACGKQCPCLTNGTCCEKYCGCPKICKNRFRGCHCAKSQCRSRQCPCFAADRECDPDVCRNCWVGCGDGTLGVPNQRGDNYECRNMKLLLKQQQRVLLGRSDVSGWGAFLKNSVGKHEYLGEYTGELISHKEADKRGKIYDRENSSFLFNLNNEFVLDAYRMGDKLKFANHSPDPNCYAKVIMVAGDHRVGIFAKERINAGEELFYDYRYEPDRAPAWARKPEAGGKDDGQPSNGRAKKLAQNTRA